MAKKDTQEKENIEPKGESILPIDIVREMKDSYLAYSMSVITSRALPDVLDKLTLKRKDLDGKEGEVIVLEAV